MTNLKKDTNLASLRDRPEFKAIRDDIFWGTWCPPCRKEIPHFVELKNKYGKDGLDIVGLNQNERGDAALVKETIKKSGVENSVNYRCAVGDQATQQKVPNTTRLCPKARAIEVAMGGYAESVLSQLRCAMRDVAPRRKE